MQFTVLRDRILVAPTRPSEWPGKHRVPETTIVGPDGKEAYAVERIDFDFGVVVQCGPEMARLKVGDSVFWRGGVNHPVLEDWVLMREGEVEGVWEP